MSLFLFLNVKRDKDEQQEADCGCRMEVKGNTVYLYQCPLHEHAPDLLAALKQCVFSLRSPDGLNETCVLKAEELIKKLEAQ